jgi:hypothetical protein
VIPVSSTESWVTDAVIGAIAFWGDHGEVFRPATADGVGVEVTVQNLPPDRVGECALRTIHLSPGLSDRPHVAMCIVTHEIGHYLGMNHVPQGDSLMAPVVAVNGSSCYWSEDDENEHVAAEQRGQRGCL